MRTLFLTMLCLAIACTTALAGEFYGTIREGGKPVKAGTKVDVKCAKGAYSAETDNLGSYRLFVPEQGKCVLSVKSGDVAPQMTVPLRRAFFLRTGENPSRANRLFSSLFYKLGF